MGNSQTKQPILWIIVPCFNEGTTSRGGATDSALLQTAPVFLKKLESLITNSKINEQSCICYVNDGSTDNTWELIEQLSKQNPHYRGVSLSRNRGHQNALLAGLMEAKDNCDITISIDCDGQDDINAMDAMIDAYTQDYDVVYGVRSKRETDTAFKRMTAEGFYKILNSMGAEVVFNHADYRLMSSAALEGLAEFPEVNLYLRGMVPLVGFNSTTVEYERFERVAGESHYPLGKMISLAVNGITSLSIKPIRFISIAGIIFSLVGFAGVIWAIVTALMGSSTVGWASTICVVCLIGGIQLLCLGVIGEYIGKIYLESKRRPRFIVEKRTWNAD